MFSACVLTGVLTRGSKFTIVSCRPRIRSLYTRVALYGHDELAKKKTNTVTERFLTARDDYNIMIITIIVIIIIIRGYLVPGRARSHNMEILFF